MSGKNDRAIFSVAEEQHGYFTAAQAARIGVPPDRVRDMLRRGVVERISRAVYRLERFPVSRWSQYMEATLWPQVRRGEVTGVISHESALEFYGMSEVSPSTVHITLPSAMRVRRKVPQYLTLHYAELAPHELGVLDGIPVTTPERAVRDAAAAHVGPALVRQAILDGRRTGHFTPAQAEHLAHDLIGESLPTLGILDDGPAATPKGGGA